jgi:hypothetical protein
MRTGRVTYLVAVRNKRPHCIRRILISALHRATQRVDYYQHDFVVEFSLDLSHERDDAIRVSGWLKQIDRNCNQCDTQILDAVMIHKRLESIPD